MTNGEIINKILEMNIQGKFFVNFHTIRPGWIDEDDGFVHGVTGTFFECVTWVIDYFHNNKYIPRFLREVVEYLDECSAPDEDAESICSMYDDDEPFDIINFKIGGHDLISEFDSHCGEYVNFVICF